MMRNFPVARTLAALALVAAAASGCAKKVTSVDAGYTQVEGTPSEGVQMLAWPDMAVTLTDYERVTVPNTEPPEIVDQILSVTSTYAAGAGAQRLTIVDTTPSGAFQLFRREVGGGYRQFQTFPLQSARRWLDTQTEVFVASDVEGSGYAPPTYVARGLVEGVSAPGSPLSNEVPVAVVPTPTLVYTGNLQPTDSLFTMAWQDVPGAAGYWVHVYQFRPNATIQERQNSGAPAPVVAGNVQDFFVGFVPAPATSYRLGQPGARVLTRRTTLNGQVYLVRVTAVDDVGRVVAWMQGERDSVRLAGANQYRRWTIGAARVNPVRRT